MDFQSKLTVEGSFSTTEIEHSKHPKAVGSKLPKLSKKSETEPPKLTSKIPRINPKKLPADGPRTERKSTGKAPKSDPKPAEVKPVLRIAAPNPSPSTRELKSDSTLKDKDTSPDSHKSAVFDLNPSSAYIAFFLILTSVKLLWINTYHSTDFEVHRNWLAITSSLPLKEWYYENTSEWTLDYPPFFAYFEYCLAQIAYYFDPQMLVISKDGYVSFATVLFQRLSVITTEVVYYLACIWCAQQLTTNTQHRFTLVVLLFANPGLLFVDHIHFQYNGFLYGIQLLSIAMFHEKRFLIGGLLFATVLNFKHIYLYQAPAYFVYILSGYCFNNGRFNFFNLVKIGAVVVSVFLVSFGPFLKDIPQVFSRLFPFKRGLCHAYWAPNVWAIYSFSDRTLLALLKLLGKADGESVSLTRGLVGDTNFAILPEIKPIYTVVLTLLFQLPILIKLWFKSNQKTFVKALASCAFSSFMFGWHVHEKAIIMALLPLSFSVLENQKYQKLFLVACAAAGVSLFPLIYAPTEVVTKFSVLGLYLAVAVELFQTSLDFNVIEKCYLAGLSLVAVYGVVHPIVFGKTLEFLPLMLTSVYCSLGLIYTWYIYSGMD